MESIYRYLRAGLIIITVIPLLFLVAANNDWEGFLDDLLG